jgi:hypothetical protein
VIEMKVLPKLCGILALVLALGTARGDTFNFSYLFGDGLLVTGSLDGTANGNFVENVTNVSVFFDGNALTGRSSRPGLTTHPTSTARSSPSTRCRTTSSSPTPTW